MNSYPIFESGQVLTNQHLNEMFSWLNTQALDTRRRLIGIGIVCGLEVSRGNYPSTIDIGRGVALSSAGHLLTLDQDTSYSRYRAYTLPVSDYPLPPSYSANDSLPLLPDIGNIELWELFKEDYQATAAEAPLSNLQDSFLNDKVVMLLLEQSDQSLRDCNNTTGECDDKGGKRSYKLRTLLLSRSSAKALWDHAIPSNSARHSNWINQRAALQPLHMGKLIISQLATYNAILEQAMAVANQVKETLKLQLQASATVYSDVLGTELTASHWGPQIDKLYLQLKEHPIRLYDVVQDIIASYNEFIAYAKNYDALCCPPIERFPFHIMLGNTNQPPPMGAQARYTKLRHEFYPSPQLQGQAKLLAHMRALYYRTSLLSQHYKIPDNRNTPIKMNFSRQYGELSQRAIAHFYQVEENDALHLNWDPGATQSGFLNQVNAPFTEAFATVPDSYDFYRFGGLANKPLDEAVNELRQIRSTLGLSFSIAAIFVPLKPNEEVAKNLIASDTTLQKMATCHMGKYATTFAVFAAIASWLLALAAQSIINQKHKQEQTEQGNESGTQMDSLTDRSADLIEAVPLDVNLFSKQQSPAKILDGIGKAATGKHSRLYKSAAQETTGSFSEKARRVKCKMDLDKDIDTASLNTELQQLERIESMLTMVSKEPSQFDTKVFESQAIALSSAGNSGVQQASQSLIQANRFIASIFSTLTKKMFNENSLPLFSQRNPGMEHLGGVAKGGTLVLLYIASKEQGQLIVKNDFCLPNACCDDCSTL